MKLLVKKGATSVLAVVFIQDSSSTVGAGLSGLVFNTSGLVCYRARADDGNAGGTAISLATATLGTWASGGFKEKDSTNMKGVYEIGLTNASLATGSDYCVLYFSGATNMAPLVLEIQLVAFDPDNAVPNANVAQWNGTAVATPATAGVPDINVLNWRGTFVPVPTTAGIPDTNVFNYGNMPASTDSSGFPQVDTAYINGFVASSSLAQVGVNVVSIAGQAAVVDGNNRLNVNVSDWAGTAVGTPATAGVPDTNVKNMNNVAATSISTVNANIGSTQPINFTGTAGSALIKADMIDIASAAVSTSTAQLGVNAVNWAGGAIPAPNVTGVPLVDIKYTLGTLSPAAAGYIGIDWGQVTNKTSTVGLTGTTVGTVTTVTNQLSAAAIATGVWTDTTAGDFTTALSIGKTIVNGVSLGTGLTINGYTGNTPQTGDAYARLGAPAGASVSADVAAVKVDTAAVKVQTDKFAFTVTNQVDANVLDWKSSTAPAMTGDAYARLGAPAGASVSTDIAAVKAAELTAAQIATGVWTDTTVGDFTTSASIGKSVLNGVSLGTGLTINAYTGDTPQTGDSYPRLGAPAGASVSADIAAVKSDIDSGVGLTLSAKQGVADTLLDRDMSAGADSGSPSVRTVRQALRFLRNKWAIASGVVTIYKEDDATASWTSALTTDATALPITSNDPTGP